MKFTYLSQHLHALRAARSGRPAGSAMRLNEVWEGAVESTLNSISEVRYRHWSMPDDVMGAFSRLRDPTTGREIAVILVNKRMPIHWQEFVAIKETMHCWSPPESYVAKPSDIASLLEGQTRKHGKYSITPLVAADVGAIAAAAEVMLPMTALEPVLTDRIDYNELAHRHGLHVDIVSEICRFDMLLARQNGSL